MSFKEPYAPHTDWLAPRGLDSTLKALLKATRPARKLAETGLVEALGRAVGPEAAPHVRVTGVRAGRVTVEVASAGLLQELTFEQKRILDTIRRDPDVTTRVIGLRFRIGRWGEPTVNGKK